MVITVAKKNLRTSPAQGHRLTILAAAGVVVAGLTLAACAGDAADAGAGGTQASPPSTERPSAEPPALVFGGAAPLGAAFKPLANAAKGTPDLNTVPTKAPVPPSTKSERDKAVAGLIADRTNARYSEQGGRTQPVAVRPLIDAPVAASTAAIARVNAPPPQRPLESAAPAVAVAPVANSAQAIIDANVGPRAPGAAPRRSTAEGSGLAMAGGGSIANPGGFRGLSDFQAATYSRSNLAGTLGMIGGNLTPNDRNVLNRTARDQIDSRGRGVVRVVGHGTGGLDRALIAANELQRLGVARNNLYVGVDAVVGPTEVFFDRAK